MCIGRTRTPTASLLVSCPRNSRYIVPQLGDNIPVISGTGYYLQSCSGPVIKHDSSVFLQFELRKMSNTLEYFVPFWVEGQYEESFRYSFMRSKATA